MLPDTCEAHAEFVTGLAVLKNDTQYIRNKICKHVEEGEKEGGFRDRLLLLEQSVSEIKKAQWTRALVSGLIGGLVGGRLAPEVVNLVIKMMFK